MKKTILFIGILSILVRTNLVAQPRAKTIAAYPIEVGYNKTSNLVFPSPIRSVDRGSASLLAQKASGVDNILQVKGAEQNFRETDLTIITADGHFYSFVVHFASDPSILNYSFSEDSSEKAMVEKEPLNEARFTAITKKITAKKHAFHKRVWNQRVKLSVDNVFIGEDVMWFAITVTNESLISFLPANARFFIQDKKRVNRTATQQIEVVPLYKPPLNKVVKHIAQTLVFPFQPFSLPSGKELIIQIEEKEGSRPLTLQVSHRLLLKAKTL